MGADRARMKGDLARRVYCCGLLGCCLAAASAPRALASEPGGGQETAYKLTAGLYRMSDHSDGWDLNLRRSGDIGNAWLGYFRLADQSVSQWRLGWDNTYGTSLRFSPSLQVASHGFIGGSLQAETGEPWFVGAGYGRTNLRNYWNLNFDPNDAYTLTAGHRGTDNQLIMVQLVHDDRQHPDERHLHFVYRQPLPEGRRLTVDALYKSGLVDGEEIRRWGLAATMDWPAWFLRLAWDPKINFTAVNALRLSVGTRF